MIPTFENYVFESGDSIIWRGLDKLAAYLHSNPDVKDAVARSMAELGDDTIEEFLAGMGGREARYKNYNDDYDSRVREVR